MFFWEYNLSLENKYVYMYADRNRKRQVSLIIYYPTHEITQSSETYSQTIVDNIKLFLSSSCNISLDQLDSLDRMYRYATKLAKPAMKDRFPVILFSHGISECTQAYENIITNLVSNGYIVIGINSTAIGGKFIQKDGTISRFIKPPDHAFDNFSDEFVNDVVLRVQIQDIKFVLSELSDFKKYDTVISKIMNIEQIGGIGHSAGGSAMTYIAREPNCNLKAVIGCDAEFNYYIKTINQVSIPYLHLISGNRYIHIPWWPSQFKPKFLLGPNNYFIGLAPDNKTLQRIEPPFYSMHSEFSDINTLKQLAVLRNYNIELQNANMFPLFGYGNSEELVTVINNSILNFFNCYIKNNFDFNNQILSLSDKFVTDIN